MKTCCMILLAAFTSLASAQQNGVTSILEVTGRNKRAGAP